MDKNIKDLFQETQRAFDKSLIGKYNEQKWFYSISATPLIANKNVIVGFNWGAKDNYTYESQNEIPTDNFKYLYENNLLGSLQRIYKPLRHYFPNEDIDNCVQTNFCFFRSKKQNQIKQADLELSTPLFIKLIDIIKPKRIIGFSSKFREYCVNESICKNIRQTQFKSNRKKVYVAKGIFKANKNEFPVYFLPHPNARITTLARDYAWNYCFKKGI